MSVFDMMMGQLHVYKKEKQLTAPYTDGHQIMYLHKSIMMLYICDKKEKLQSKPRVIESAHYSMDFFY